LTPDTRLLLYALAAVGTLILLIARFKLHPFIALVGVSLGLGLAVGMPPGTVVKAFQDGVGNVLGFIAIVVGLGTMLGKMMAESGAATRIAITLIGLFGERRVHWAIMFVAFIVGMLAVGAYHADVGRTILYGLLVGVPTAALAGPIFGAWIAPRIAAPLESPIATQLEGSSNIDAAPGFGISIFTVLIPVILMLLSSAADVMLEPASSLRAALVFVGQPTVALLLALLVSFWSLRAGPAGRFTAEQVRAFCNDCLAPTAVILLVIGAGGGFNQVLVQSGVGAAVADMARGSTASPLVLAWTIAALIRVATGSATVAMITAAGIVAPIATATPGSHPELLVLATGAGSLVLSHVNDSGFWLIKEFFNMTVADTLKTWTVAETIIGVAGLGFTMLLSLVL
jgi:GntP family gluconate:H+ symporter